MSSPYLLIDGYNLLHAAGMARKNYAQGQLERARRQLLIFLAQHLTTNERERATVVFDAGNAPSGVARQTIVELMTVLFAPTGGDADSEIEQILLTHSVPRSIRVVSSDHRLQKAARRRRAEFVDSEVFVEDLERRGPTANRDSTRLPPRHEDNPKFGGEDEPGEMEHWLEVFGDIPEAAELQSEVEMWRSWTEELRKELEAELEEDGRAEDKSL